MGLGLYLVATPLVANPLDVVEHFLRASCAEVLEALNRGDGSLGATLHPAAEEVEFTLEGSALLVSAKTSSVGPGYHAYLCELLHELEARLGNAFGPVPDEQDEEQGGDGDETGYFTNGDRAALEDEMLAWLRGLCDVVAEQLAQGSEGFMISMGTDHVFEFDGALATPMGPRSAAWLEAARQDPRSGIDLFPWWGLGLGADHAAGRALVRMWSEVRWREPMDDDEDALLEKVDADLRRAHELDPALPLPWAEWAEMLDWLAREDALAHEVHERARGLTAGIGYRRRPVRVRLAGRWSVRVPGEMSSSFDEDSTWCGFMPGRTLWMSSFTIGDPENPTRSAAQTLPSKEPDQPLFELGPLADGYAGRASLGKTSEGDIELSVEIALPHRLALFTFVLADAADLDWARQVAAAVRG